MIVHKVKNAVCDPPPPHFPHHTHISTQGLLHAYIVNVRSYREWEGGRETVISSLAYAHADRHPKRLSTLQGPYLKPPCIHEYNTHNYSIKDDYLKELTVNVSHI